MLVVEFPSREPQRRVTFTVIGVTVHAHELMARLPNGKQVKIAEHVGVAGWRITNSGTVTNRVFPHFTVRAAVA